MVTCKKPPRNRTFCVEGRFCLGVVEIKNIEKPGICGISCMVDKLDLAAAVCIATVSNTGGTSSQ